MTMKREKNNTKGGKEVKIMFFEVLYGIHLIFMKLTKNRDGMINIFY